MRRARCVTLAVGGAPGAAELGAEGLGQSLQHRRVGWAEYEGQRALRDGPKGEEGAVAAFTNAWGFAKQK